MGSYGAPTFREAFRGNHDELVRSMRVNCSFLNRLRDKGLLTGHCVEEIQACSTEDDRVDKLLSILERSDNTLFPDFIDALVEDEQQHVVRDWFSNLHSCVDGSGCSRLTTRVILIAKPEERQREFNRLLEDLMKRHDILHSSFANNSHCVDVLRPLKYKVEAAVGRLQYHPRDVSTVHQTGNQKMHRILTDLYRSVSRRLDAHCVAVAMLLDEGLTPEEYSAIKDRTQRQAAAETLLDILLKDSHCTKFDSFLQALIHTDQKQIYVDIVSEALVSGCNIGSSHRRQVRECRFELVNSVDARYSSLADLLYDSESWLSQREYEVLKAIPEHWNSVRDVLIASLQAGPGRPRITLSIRELEVKEIRLKMYEELGNLLKSHDILYSSFADNSRCVEVLHPLKREVEAAVGRFHTRYISAVHQTGNQELHRILTDLYRSLSRRLDAHRVADAMLLDEGLTPEEYSAIKGRIQRQAAAETLLDILLKDSHCTKFDSFLQALIDTDQKQIYVDIVSQALVTGCNIGANHRRQVCEFRFELVNSVDARYSSLADLLYDSESWLSQREYDYIKAIPEHWDGVRHVLIASGDSELNKPTTNSNRNCS